MGSPAAAGAAIQLRTVTCGGRPLPGVAVDPEEELRWSAPAPCPGEDLAVEVRYVQTVITEDGVKRLVLPTEPGAEVEVVLDDWVAVGALWSDSHPITTDRRESERVVVRQEPLRGEDRPWFALSWTVATSSRPHRYVMNELLERRLNEIRHCYQQRLTRSPGLEGRVDVRFVIHPDGSVSDAEVSESTLADPAVERCLLDVLERLRYPAWGTVVVHYPFIFHAA